ncbi:GAF domain-containing protein, partial [Candidatus Sumerlaeota bacterium]|nr:GAF domain-containing protein [Candidatus Sumerlaeota bacterium]
MAPSTNSSTDPPVARQTLPEALTSPSDTQKREKSSTGIFPKRSALVSICNAMVSNLDLKSVLETILSVTLAEMRAQEGSVLLFNESQDRLEMLAALGLPEEIARRGYIPRKGSIAEWVIENDKPTIINGDVQSKNFSAAGRGRFIVSAMCVPLRASGKVIGTINLNRTDPEAGVFQKRDTDAMVILGSQAAVSIENSRLHEAIMRGERLAAIGQTVAGISHCMKNLLTSLKGGLSICEMGIEKQDWKLESQGMDI